MNVKFNFKDYVAVITGAGSGIARGIAEGFAKAGANVVVSDFSEKGGLETVELCKKYGVDAIFVKTDVSKEEDNINLFKQTMDKFGKADILILGAGVAGRGITGNPITNVIESDFDQCYNVNVKGIFFGAKVFYDYFKERKFGKVVTIASISGTRPSPHLAHYSSSKAAAIQLTKILAIELGPFNVNVNAICPGYVYTAMHDKTYKQYIAKYPEWFSPDATPEDVSRVMSEHWFLTKRPQTVEDMANAAMYLCSDQASELMGQIIDVAGSLKV